MNWRDQAACRHYDPELWFPVANPGHVAKGSPVGEQIADAKRICYGCPVRVECLTYALDQGEQGIWGGLTDQERRRVKNGTPIAKVLQPSPRHAPIDENAVELWKQLDRVRNGIPWTTIAALLGVHGSRMTKLRYGMPLPAQADLLARAWLAQAGATAV